MRYAVVFAYSLLVLFSCASAPAEKPVQVSDAPHPMAEHANSKVPELEKLRLAVLDMEDTTGDTDEESLRQATEYLRILVVRSGKFVVVSDEEKHALIRELRKESYDAQYDETQRVPLGQRVAANAALISTILKVSEEYLLKAELIDLATETIIAGATEKFNPDTFQQAIEAVARAVAGDEATEEPATAAAQEDECVVPTSGLSAQEATESAKTGSGTRPGINFLILRIIAAHRGQEPDTVYREAEERRREHEKRRHEDSTVSEPYPSPAQKGDSDAQPAVRKPIRFSTPVKKAIRFRLIQKTRTSSPSVRPHPVVPFSSQTENEPPDSDPETREQPPRKQQEPRYSIPKDATSTRMSVPSSEKKEEEKETEEDSSKDSREKKRKKTLPGTIFVPRR